MFNIKQLLKMEEDLLKKKLLFYVLNNSGGNQSTGTKKFLKNFNRNISNQLKANLIKHEDRKV